MKKLLILTLLLFIPSVVCGQCYNGSGVEVSITGFTNSDMIIVGNYGTANDACEGSESPETCCTGVDTGTCSDIPSGYDLYCTSWYNLISGMDQSLIGDIDVYIDPIVFYEDTEPDVLDIDMNGYTIHIRPSDLNYSPSTSDITTGPRIVGTYEADGWVFNHQPTDSGKVIIEGITFSTTDTGPLGWFRIAGANPNTLVVRNCVFKGGVYGISYGNTNSHVIQVYNNFFYDTTGIIISLPSSSSPPAGSFFANNTMIGAGCVVGQSRTGLFFNNLMSCLGVDLLTHSNLTGYNNICDDATCTDGNWGTGSGNVPSTVLGFTAATENEYFLASGDTAAHDAGLGDTESYDDNLVAHYKFEIDAPLADSSGNGNTLTAGAGSPSTSYDSMCGDHSMEYAQGAYHDIPNASLTNMVGDGALDDLTVCAFVNFGSANTRKIASMWGTYPTGSWTFGANATGYLNIGIMGAWYDSQTSTVALADDGTTWYHVCASYEDADDTTRLYAWNMATDALVFNETDTLDYAMGTSAPDFEVNASAGGSNDEAGFIDDLRVYNVVLTTAQMDDIRIRFELDGLRQSRIGNYDIGAYEYVAGDRSFFIADDGSDSNTGLSHAQRWDGFTNVDTLELRPGDTVQLYEGDTWADEFKPARAIGSVNNRITITSYDQTAADPIITGASGTNSMTLLNPYMVDIENIDIENSAGDMGIRIEGGDNVTIKDTDVSWGSPDGILLYWLNDFWLDNVTSDNNDSIGLHVRGTTGTNDVQNSSFDNNQQTSQEIYGWGVWLSGHLKAYEQSHGAVSTSTFDEFEDDTYDEDVDIRNCTASNNGYMGMALHDGETSYCTADSNGDGWMSMEVWGFSLSSEGSALADDNEVVQPKVDATADSSSGATITDADGDFVNATAVDDWVFCGAFGRSQIASRTSTVLTLDDDLSLTGAIDYVVGEAGTVHHYKSSEHERGDGDTDWLSVHPLSGSSGSWDTSAIYRVTSNDKDDAYSWTPAAAVDCVTDSSDWTGGGFDWRWNAGATVHHCTASNTRSPNYKVQQEGFGFNFDDASKQTIGWRNLSFGNDGAGYEFNFAGYHGSGFDDACELYNSTSYNNCQDDSTDCGELHIHFNQAYENDCYIKVKNNIFYGGDSGGVALLADNETTEANVELDYNTYYMDADGDVTIDWEDTDYVADHVSTDDFDDFVTAHSATNYETSGQAVTPGLNDPDNDDFTLTASSNCMEVGYDASSDIGCSPCFDGQRQEVPMDGENDNTDVGWDMGWDEYRYGPAINGPYGWTITGGSIKGAAQ